jgi:hypothetical protein
MAAGIAGVVGLEKRGLSLPGFGRVAERRRGASAASRPTLHSPHEINSFAGSTEAPTDFQWLSSGDSIVFLNL